MHSSCKKLKHKIYLSFHKYHMDTLALNYIQYLFFLDCVLMKHANAINLCSVMFETCAFLSHTSRRNLLEAERGQHEMSSFTAFCVFLFSFFLDLFLSHCTFFLVLSLIIQACLTITYFLLRPPYLFPGFRTGSTQNSL